MVDVFEEVEGELRTERYKELGKRLLPWIIAGLVVGIIVVGGFFAYVKHQENQANKASEAYARGLSALEAGDGGAAFTQFGQVPKGAKAYRSLALMQQAGIRLDENKNKEAAALLDQASEVAPKGKVGEILADAARLKSAFALMDQASYADIEARLRPLTEENRPYRAFAREALALAKINAGKVKEARQDLVVLSLMTEAPEAARARARTTISMIDSGLLASVPAVVKAAAALPPMPSLPPGMMLPPGVQGVPMGPQGAAPAEGAVQ